MNEKLGKQCDFPELGKTPNKQILSLFIISLFLYFFISLLPACYNILDELCNGTEK